MPKRTNPQAPAPGKEHLKEFIDELAKVFNLSVFNRNSNWECPHCRWAGLDERICDICEVLQEACQDVQGEEGLT